MSDLFCVCDPQEINQENNRRIENSLLSYNLIRSYNFTKLSHYALTTVTKALHKDPVRLSQVEMVASQHFGALIMPYDIQASSYVQFSSFIPMN